MKLRSIVSATIVLSLVLVAGQSANGQTTPVKKPVDGGGSMGVFGRLVVKNLGPVINSKGNDFAPTLTADGLTMFFVSNRHGGLGAEDLWITTRTDANTDSGAWSQPEDFSDLNSSAAEGAVSLAADGRTIYFATSRNTTVSGDVDIWVATLNGTRFENVHEVGAPVNTPGWESQPSISPDGRKLFFASNRPGKIGSEGKENVDIFVSHLLPDGHWGEPINLGSKINTGRYDGSPYLAADGTTLYFSSDGRGGGGGLKILKSEWKGPSDTDWTEPGMLPAPINSAGSNDFFISFSAATSSLYFASDRTGGYGAFDIWVALNPPAGSKNGSTHKEQ